DGHGKTDIRVGNRTLRAVRLESKFALRLIEIRSETLRFQVHPLRHVVRPRTHGRPENSHASATVSQVRSQRQSIGAGPDDDGVQNVDFQNSLQKIRLRAGWACREILVERSVKVYRLPLAAAASVNSC